MFEFINPLWSLIFINSNRCILEVQQDRGPLHMSPVDRAGSVTEMKSYGDFQPAFRDEKFEKVLTRPFRREI